MFLKIMDLVSWLFIEFVPPCFIVVVAIFLVIKFIRWFAWASNRERKEGFTKAAFVIGKITGVVIAAVLVALICLNTFWAVGNRGLAGRREICQSSSPTGEYSFRAELFSFAKGPYRPVEFSMERMGQEDEVLWITKVSLFSDGFQPAECDVSWRDGEVEVMLISEDPSTHAKYDGDGQAPVFFAWRWQ